MANAKKSTVPLYGIDTFSKSETKKQYQIEVFDSNRHFKVDYPHRHDFFEILFLTQGSGTHTIDFVDYPIEPNSIFFLSPGQIHSIDLSQDIYGYIFLFTSEFYLFNKSDKNKIFEYPFLYQVKEANPPLCLTETDDITFLTQLFRKGCLENSASGESAEEFVRSLLDLMLSFCKSRYPDLHALPMGSKGSLMVKKFKQLLEEHYTANFQVKDFADRLHVTPNYLNETVKKRIGRTASDLINEKRIIEIKKLLLHTELDINEIAEALQFSDQSYFSKYFKNLTGKTPKEFRGK